MKSASHTRALDLVDKVRTLQCLGVGGLGLRDKGRHAAGNRLGIIESLHLKPYIPCKKEGSFLSQSSWEAKLELEVRLFSAPFRFPIFPPHFEQSMNLQVGLRV